MAHTRWTNSEGRLSIFSDEINVRGGSIGAGNLNGTPAFDDNGFLTDVLSPSDASYKKFMKALDAAYVQALVTGEEVDRPILGDEDEDEDNS